MTDLHLDEFHKLLVIHHVHLVQENHQLRHTNLPCEENVFACLWHGPVGGCDHEDPAVHLGSARDHVFHVISVSWAVNMRVVACGGLVLYVSSRNGDTTSLESGTALVRPPVILLVAGLAVGGPRYDSVLNHKKLLSNGASASDTVVAYSFIIIVSWRREKILVCLTLNQVLRNDPSPARTCWTYFVIQSLYPSYYQTILDLCGGHFTFSSGALSI